MLDPEIENIAKIIDQAHRSANLTLDKLKEIMPEDRAKEVMKIAHIACIHAAASNLTMDEFQGLVVALQMCRDYYQANNRWKVVNFTPMTVAQAVIGLKHFYAERKLTMNTIKETQDAIAMKGGFRDTTTFLNYLTNDLIPGLRQARRNATADDLALCVRLISAARVEEVQS